MKRRRTSRSTTPSIAVADVPLGVLAGAAVGAFAGPVGIVAGALIGSGVGAVLAIAQNRDMHRATEEVDRFDESVGVTRGSLGAPGLSHPPATVGTYSAASVGMSGDTETVVSEGPINPPDDPL